MCDNRKSEEIEMAMVGSRSLIMKKKIQINYAYLVLNIITYVLLHFT